jgi:hypothetical protein
MSDLNRVVELIKAGDTSQARLILLDILASDRQNEQAWLYLAACAENKTEFEQSVKRVLTLNPFNAQALRLAKANKIELPEAAKAGQKQEKKRKRAQKKVAAQRSRIRPLLYLLLSLVVGAGAFLWFQESTKSDEPAPVAEETPGEEVAEAEDTPVPTATPTDTDTPTPEPTPTVLPILDDPVEYLGDIQVMSGRGDSDLTTGDVFAPDDSLNVVIEVGDHGEPLTLTVDLVALTGAPQTVSAQEILLAGIAQTVVIPVAPRGPTWQPGNWAAQVQVNGTSLPGLQFRIAAPTTPTATERAVTNADATEEPVEPTQGPTATRTPRPTATQTPTPTEIPIDPTTRLVYNQNTVYIINITDELQDISGLVFLQERADDTTQNFEAIGWQQGSFRSEGSVYALQPDSCFQIGVAAGVAATPADECVRLNAWQQAGVLERFWLPVEDGPEVFLVMLNDEELVECEIDAGECEFELPEVEE